MKFVRLSAVVILAAFAVCYMSAFALADTRDSSRDGAGLVDLSLKNVSVKDAIDSLFSGRGLKYYVQPGVSGNIVELKLSGVTFDQALNALVDAADLTYTIQDGAYIIGTGKPKTQVSAPAVSGQPTQAAPHAGMPSEYVPPPVQGLPPVQPNPATQVVVNQNPGPVYYGSPGVGADYYGGYPYGSYYRAGNLNFLYGWPPVQIGGTNSVLSFGPNFPPIPGWVSPDTLRFLRSYYVLRPQPYFMPGY